MRSMTIQETKKVERLSTSSAGIARRNSTIPTTRDFPTATQEVKQQSICVHTSTAAALTTVKQTLKRF